MEIIELYFIHNQRARVTAPLFKERDADRQLHYEITSKIPANWLGGKQEMEY